MAGLHKKEPIRRKRLIGSSSRRMDYIYHGYNPSIRDKKVKKNGASGSRIKLDKGIKVRTTYHV